MERSTIDFGIDLGTTNSEIAVLEGTKARIIKTNENADFTPSAVSFDEKGELRVGQRAKEQQKSLNETLHSDIALRFKLQMGYPGSFKEFKVNRKKMTPEELSAEVLKKLRGDVQQDLGEEITAAVISVPAAFELPQNSATDKAAKLAGLSFSPLVQEPVAAALAYGFQTTRDRVFWMVYDFGGGTFDSAIIQVRDEQIQVVNHGGNNQLGGGDIDEAIVTQILIPLVAKEFGLSPEDQRWKGIRRILNHQVELAKIQLSRAKETDFEVSLILGKDGVSTPFECVLKKSDIERLTEPFVEKSINLCKAVLAEKRLSTSDIEKLILVGGPTKAPIFKDMLMKGLGIPLELSVDPLTVVAQGAAIFAGTQIIPTGSKRHAPLSVGQFKLELDYKPIGDETEPAIGGRVAAEGQSLQGYTIEFVETKTAWRSGKINVRADGTFVSSVHAERECRNEFLIELRDARGDRHETVPDRFTYTIGITISAQTLVNDISIALANGDILPFFKKGTVLPAKHREVTLHTTVAVKSGDSGTLLKIPVVEGTNKRADRNPLIDILEVSGHKVRRNVPIGSPIEITLTVDESRIVRAIAYVPILDEEFEKPLNPIYPDISENDLDSLIDQAQKAKTRLGEIRNDNQKVNSKDANNLLQQIDNEHLVEEIDNIVPLAKQNDKAALNRLQRRRSELDARLDTIEELIAWPALVLKAETDIQEGRKLVDDHGDAQDKEDFSRLEEGVRKAVGSNNHDILQQKLGVLSQLVMQVLMKHPGFWVAHLEKLAGEYKSKMRDQAEAERLIAQGYRAINTEDAEALRTAVHQLYGLLPASIAEDIPGYGSTIGF